MKDNTVQKIREYMKATGLKQAQLSTLFGISKWTLSRWLNNKHKPSHAYKRLIEKHVK